jgi:hypothetical protein
VKKTVPGANPQVFHRDFHSGGKQKGTHEQQMPEPVLLPLNF